MMPSLPGGGSASSRFWSGLSTTCRREWEQKVGVCCVRRSTCQLAAPYQPAWLVPAHHNPPAQGICRYVSTPSHRSQAGTGTAHLLRYEGEEGLEGGPPRLHITQK